MSDNKWNDIKSRVDENGGVITLLAAELREAQGAGRLTERINRAIHDSLAARGLGHVPLDVECMPTYQHEEVRVYDRTSSIGRVIEAAHRPGDEEDERLREAIDAEAVTLLSQIRDLVAE